MWGLKEMKWSTANHIWIQSESPPRGLNDSNFRQHIGESQQNPMREEEPEMSQLFSLIWDCFLHPFCKPAPTVLFPEIFLWQDGSTVFKRSSTAAESEGKARLKYTFLSQFITGHWVLCAFTSVSLQEGFQKQARIIYLQRALMRVEFNCACSVILNHY